MFLKCFGVTAQISDYEYNFVNIDQRSSQRAVSTIVQDSLGLIWMGTNGVGLQKYNGLDFVSYKQDFTDCTSLNSSLIYKAFVDVRNRLWVGTEAGLNVYDRDTDAFHQVTLYKDSVALESVPIRAIQACETGKLIVGSHYHGLFAVDPETLTGHNVSMGDNDVSSLEINSIIKNEDRELLIGTNQGLFSYEAGKVVQVSLNLQGLKNDKNVPYDIESMIKDEDGSIWIGSFENGLVKIEIDSFNSFKAHNYRISSERILSIAQAPDGNILCGTENDGLFALKKNGKLVKHYRYNKFDVNSIKANSIWSIFVDRQDRIWIGYYNNGVGVYDKLYDKFMDIRSLANVNNSLQSPSVSAIAGDKYGQMWIGLDGGGVDVFNPKTGNIVHLNNPRNTMGANLSAEDVTALFIDSRNNVWVGTWNSGIYHLPDGSRRFINYTASNTNGGLKSDRVMSFAEDPQGTIWIGSYVEGLHSYHPERKEFVYHNERIFSDPTPGEGAMRIVLIDKNNTIWMGTTAGLYKLLDNGAQNQKAISLRGPMYKSLGNPLVVDAVVSLFEDSRGDIWIGTDGAGLCKYNPVADSFTWYGTNEGIKQETIASILEDDNGDLWIGGNNGLSHFDFEEQAFKNFDINDGLLANDFNFNSAFKDQNGMLYFGNYGGINYIDPNHVKTNTNKPEVYFTDLRLFNNRIGPNDEESPLDKVIAQTDALTLKHSQSVFTIEYAAINFTRPKKNQYAYILEGFDDAWNYVGQTRSATYTNISPGNYTFKVKAANNDGVWNETPKTLQITILRPWWATNVALASYILAILLVSYFLARYISQRIREKRMVEAERERRLQEEALNDKKLQFFTNISHEFRTPLTLILNPLEDILHDSRHKLSRLTHEKLRVIHKNTSRLKRLIDELMDFRKLEINKFSVRISELEATKFVNEVSGHFEEEAALRNIILMVESDDDPIPFWSDPSLLEKVIFNILSNAFKITPDNGFITIGVFKCGQNVHFPLIDAPDGVKALEIYIEDTGHGIKKEELEKIFERFYQVKEMNRQYYGGTGIGLEMVKSFVDLLKGKVIVESEEGVGTKFRIFLPLGKDHFESDEVMAAPKSENTVASQPIPEDSLETTYLSASNRTLLIVEDNAELRAYLKNELESEYTVFEAVNGVQGQEIALKRLPDLILTDVVMSEMDGFEFCTRIRQDIKTSHIPVLMLTAKAMTDDWVKGIDCGADIYLSKPFEMKVLRAQLRQIIQSRQILFNKYLSDSDNFKIPDNTSSLDKNFMTQVLNYITKNIADENLNVESLADELHLSRSQLYRKIKAMTGLTVTEFLRKIRLEHAKRFIESGTESISEVCYKVGFSSPSYFTKCFKAQFGVLPTELK
ncbi:hybrid sensor histidine kinase/response regulator transcription factor [Flagellimonas iocasae]|uniref:histidine kinase n=1 Tax=Flagellimonas iocasae TaxID=2055905 RepID=A0ABW4XTZ1_9FLAO